MLCFSDFSCSADIETIKAASELISDCLSGKDFQGHHQSGHLCAWQAFPSVYFTGGQGEIDSSCNLRFVIISMTCNNSMYKHSDRSFTDKSMHFFVLLASFFIFLHRDAAVLGWQGTLPCSLYSCGTSRYVLSFTFGRGIKHSGFRVFLNFC